MTQNLTHKFGGNEMVEKLVLCRIQRV
jgi:hypothetical protein